jgi:hypothetical protein
VRIAPGLASALAVFGVMCALGSAVPAFAQNVFGRTRRIADTAKIVEWTGDEDLANIRVRRADRFDQPRW